MKTVKLTPKASQDLEDIWYYGCRHFQVMSDNNIGTPRPELVEDIFALPVERHMLYFIQTDTDIIIIRILSQHQDAGRHLNWQ